MFHRFLPVGGSVLYCLLLLGCLVAGFVAGALLLHGGNGGIVEDLDCAALDGLVQLLLAEGLALDVEVGNVELEVHPQLVSYHLLLESRAGVFPAQQLADDVYLML